MPVLVLTLVVGSMPAISISQYWRNAAPVVDFRLGYFKNTLPLIVKISYLD